MESATSQSTNADPAGAPAPRLERYALAGVFCLYFVMQVNAVLHKGHIGQDFQWHTDLTLEASQDSPEYFRSTFERGSQEPPFYYMLCGRVYNLTDGIHYLEVIALLQIAINIGAFALFYTVLQDHIGSALIRLSCLIFMLFLPASTITVVVFASDGLAIPLFLTAVYFFGRLVRAQTRGAYLVANGAVMLLLVAGMFTKYTFVSVVAASAVCLLLLARMGVLSPRRLVFSLATLTLIPGVCAFFEFRACMRRPHFEISRTWVNPFTSPHMSVRSIVFPRLADTHILSGPPYFERNETPPSELPPEVLGTEGVRWALLVRNKHSYPALLHLGIYTDVLNIYQGGKYQRGESKARRMTLAVKTGLLFSLLGVLALPIMLCRGFYATVIRPDRRWALLAVMSVMSLAWFCNIVGFLPFIPTAYDHGFWLPRLIAGPLLCFIFLAFVFLDSAGKRVGAVRWLCLPAVLFQSGLHLAFLWPWCAYQ
jgi:hypothetical protein